MNKRDIVTVIAFLLPIVVVAVLIASPHKEPNGTVSPKIAKREQAKPETLEELLKRRERVKARLEVVEKMTQADWEAEGKALGSRAKNRAPSLPEAVARNRDELMRIEKAMHRNYPNEAAALKSSEQNKSMEQQPVNSASGSANAESAAMPAVNLPAATEKKK